MDFANVVCPISGEKIDSNLSRTTVFLNVVLMALFIVSLNPIYIYVVSLDYFIRAFINVKYSPVRFVASTIVKPLGLEKKQIDLAQKIFASRLGFVCAFVSLILFSYELTTASVFVAGFLMILSTLDSVFDLCMGCLIYNYLVYPFYSRKKMSS